MYMLSERYRVLCSGEGTHSSTLFYIPQKDVIVVGNYTIARMIVDYMSLDDKEKKDMHEAGSRIWRESA